MLVALLCPLPLLVLSGFDILTKHLLVQGTAAVLVPVDLRH